MRTVFKSKDFIFATLLVVTISLFSSVIYQKANSVCKMTKENCVKAASSSGNSEMLWESFPRQFISSVFFR